jgi:hypothetical protein
MGIIESPFEPGFKPLYEQIVRLLRMLFGR